MASSSLCLLWLWLLLPFTAFSVVQSLPEPCITSANCTTYEYGTTTCFLDECIRCSDDLEVPFHSDQSTCGKVCDGPGLQGDQQCLTRDGSPEVHCFRLSSEVRPRVVNGYYKYNGTATYKDAAGNVTLIKGYCAECVKGYIYDATVFDCVRDPDAPPPPPPPALFGETPPYYPPPSGPSGGIDEVPPPFDPPSTNQPRRKKKKTNVGAIVGSLIGVFGFLGIAAAAIILLIRRHNQKLLAYTGTQGDVPPSGPGPEGTLPPPPQGDPKPPYPPTQVPTSQV